MIIPQNANFTVLFLSFLLKHYDHRARIHFSFFHGFTMQNSYSTYIISDNGLLFPHGLISTPPFLQLPLLQFLKLSSFFFSMDPKKEEMLYLCLTDYTLLVSNASLRQKRKQRCLPRQTNKEEKRKRFFIWLCKKALP